MSFWIPNHNKNATTNNKTTEEKHTNCQNRADTGRGKGPTTEAGRKKQAEAEAARKEKEERRKEKNRKKRQAYRERQQQWTPKGRSAWTKAHGRRNNDHNKRSTKNDEKRKNKAGDVETTKKWKKPKTEDEWEFAMEKAMNGMKYDRMVKLFKISFKWALSRGPSATARETTTKYRTLSIRFHPDKYPDKDGEPYKVAFQALNAAHEDVRASIFD